MNFKPRIQAALIVGVICLVGYITMRFLQGSIAAKGVPTAHNQFRSFEERRMPCGRILQRTVEEQDGMWTKTVRLMDPSGKEINSKTAVIADKACDQIRVGTFVPGLWGSDGALGCLLDATKNKH